jgi:O-antigen/teichoic acid export membrane protein
VNNNKEISQKFLTGIKQNLISSVLKHLVTFVVSIFLSRILSPADFGLIGMSTIFITFTQALSNLGLTSGIIREKSPDEVQLNSVFYFNIGVASLLTLILFLSSGLIAKFYNEVRIEMLVKASSFLFILNAANNVHGALFYKKMEIKVTRVASIYGSIIAGFVGISAALGGLGVWSLVLSTYTSTVFFTVYIWFKSEWRPKLLFNLNALKAMFPFGIRVFLIEYIDQIFTRMDVVLIGKFFSPATLGYYFRALSLNEIVTKYTSQSLSGVFFPTIRKFDYDKAQIFPFFLKSLSTIGFISSFLTGLLFICSKEIIVTLFGAKWIESTIYFQFLAFVSLIYPFGIIFNGVFLGTDKAQLQLKLELLKKVLAFLALLIGIKFGIKTYLVLLVSALFLGIFITFWVLNTIFIGTFKTLLLSFIANLIPMIVGILSIRTGLALIETYLSLNIITKLISEGTLFVTLFILTSRLMRLPGYQTIIQIITSKFKLKLPIFLMPH